MQLIRIVLLVIVIAVFGNPGTAQDKAADAAKKAELAWLNLVDDAKYKESWESASAYFKVKVTEGQWEQAIKSARAPLGMLLTRSLQDATRSNSLPGAPDGTYVVAHFQSSFEHKQSGVETVVATLEKDGSWRVMGYFIR